jgi:hypothetical protein
MPGAQCGAKVVSRYLSSSALSAAAACRPLWLLSLPCGQSLDCSSCEPQPKASPAELPNRRLRSTQPLPAAALLFSSFPLAVAASELQLYSQLPALVQFQGITT